MNLNNVTRTPSSDSSFIFYFSDKNLTDKYYSQRPNFWWRIFAKSFTYRLMMRVCVCPSVRPWPLGILFWKHVQPCLWCQLVTMGGISGPFFDFFENFNFWPFGGHFGVILDIFSDIFINRAAIFSGMG